jgi:2-polyprenyl-3-methyl-5-hydroxy-6-metoxy-1,4-benzoquinol methylase
MDIEDIRRHWSEWAATYGTDVRATTRTWTAKALELDALGRRLQSILSERTGAQVLEVGCGNGINCIELAKQLPGARFDGVDYVPDMVRAAAEKGRANGVHRRVRFFEGDVLTIEDVAGLDTSYDVVFTDRCLINLNTVELQKQAISALASKVRPRGYFIMIENSMATYQEQNRCRTLLGLPSRSPAKFNLFFDESELRPHIASIGLDLVDVEDFASLHDLLLYVLVPSINGGKIEYDHPLVQAATKLSIQLSGDVSGRFGSFGQNRMFVCRRLPAGSST